MSSRAVWFFLLLTLVAPLTVFAQDVASGPEKGQKVPGLKVFDTTGTHAGKEVDYAADRKEKPTLYVIVQSEKWDRPMARFLKKLDEAVQKDGKDGYVVAIWLTGDVEKTKEYLPKAQQSLQFQTTALTCFTGDKTGPKDWGVNADAHLTVVLANKQKVAARFGYRSVNETDVPAVLEAFTKARKE